MCSGMKVAYREGDVVVAGGGVSGIVAAIASARNGADTILIERYGYLGGMFTGGNMAVLNAPPIGGIGKEIFDKLIDLGHARMCPVDPPNYPIFHYASEYSANTLAFDPEMAKIVLFDIAEEAGVKLILHSLVTGAVVKGDAVGGVVVVNKSGREVVAGKIVVDATADGDVAFSAGAPFLKGHPKDEEKKLFAMTMLVRLSHVDWAKVSEYSRRDSGLRNAIKKAVGKGDLPYYKPREVSMTNYWGHDHPELSHLWYEDGALLWGGTVEGVDGTNIEDLTRAEVEVRKHWVSELNFLREYVPGFEHARVESSGVSIGVRDTRHIIGEYTLTGKDLLERRRFPDVVAYNLPPVIGIPYRCLVPKNIEDLLICGNCISTIPGSTQMGTRLGSYNDLKDIPTMMTTGEAAGVAAALCANTGVTPRKLDVKMLQKRLTEQGALVAREVIEEYGGRKLPSGISIADYWERRHLEARKRWEKLGEL